MLIEWIENMRTANKYSHCDPQEREKYFTVFRSITGNAYSVVLVIKRLNMLSSLLIEMSIVKTDRAVIKAKRCDKKKVM